MFTALVASALACVATSTFVDEDVSVESVADSIDIVDDDDDASSDLLEALGRDLEDPW